MKNNGPVTNREIILTDGAMLVSRTDLHGIMTFVNVEFSSLSGYAEEELIGAPHNLLRHPDMPKEAFADLWKSIKNGQPWEGMVKNRAKSGDHYWVRANVTPMVQDGTVTGYISVRSKPSRAQVADAEALYAALRDGRGQHIRFANGQALKGNVGSRLCTFATSVTGRMILAFALFIALIVAVGGLCLGGMRASNQALHSVYEDRAVPIVQLTKIDDQIRDSALQIALMQNELAGGQSIEARMARIKKGFDQTTSQLDRVAQWMVTEEEVEAARKFVAAAQAFGRDVVQPALAAGTAKDADALRGLTTRKLPPLFKELVVAQQELLSLEIANAGSSYEDSQQRFKLLVAVAGGTVLFAVLASVFVARFLLRSMLAPLTRLEGHFESISSDDFTRDIPSEAAREFWFTYAMLRGMRAKLGYSAIEKRETAQRAEAKLRHDMTSLTETLDGEVRETVGDISRQVARLAEGAERLSVVAEQLRSEANEVSASVQTTAANVQTVAGATEELEASGRQISAQVTNGSALAEEARQKADMASASVAGVSQAAERIGSVVTIIRDIASQTHLLALNATIEAARAGEAGRGFAVVAGEVKNLARQTEDGIATVSGQAEAIGTTTQQAVAVVGTVTQSIRDLDLMTGEVARAAEEQRAATAEIMQSAGEAARHTQQVAVNVAAMLDGVETTSQTAVWVNDLSARVARDISALQRRLYVILHSAYGGDRRRESRVTAAVRFSAQFGDLRLSGFTGDLSLGGAFLVPSGAARPTTEQGVVELEGVGRIDCRVVADNGVGLCTAFTQVEPAVAETLARRLAAAKAEDAPRVVLAVSVADAAGQALAAAVADGRISEEALFCTDYHVVPHTDPVQMTAPHTPLVEALFPSLIDPPLAGNTRLLFCAGIDRGGYVAVHNKIYSQPPRPDDPVWNAAHVRNRRLFHDRTGILAARCTAPLVLTYPRDMGGGVFEVVQEVDAPIMVNGRRWGAIRTGYRLE